MRVNSLIIISIVGSLCGAGAAGAGDGDGPAPAKRERPDRPGMRGGRGAREGHSLGMDRLLASPEMREKLGLTETQTTTLHQKGKNLRERQMTLMGDMREAAENQAGLMKADELDKKAIMQSVNRLGRLRTQLAKLRIEHLFIVREVLTDEQLVTVKKTMRSRMEAHRRRGPDAKDVAAETPAARGDGEGRKARQKQERRKKKDRKEAAVAE